MLKSMAMVSSIFVCTVFASNIFAMDESEGSFIIQFPNEEAVLLSQDHTKRYGAFGYMRNFPMVETKHFSWDIEQLPDGTHVTPELMQKVIGNKEPSSAHEAAAMFMLADYLGGEGKKCEQRLKKLACTGLDEDLPGGDASNVRQNKMLAHACLKYGMFDKVDVAMRYCNDEQQKEQLGIRKRALLNYVKTVEDVIDSAEKEIDFWCCCCIRKDKVDLSNRNIEYPYGLGLLASEYPVTQLNLSGNKLRKSYLSMIMRELPEVRTINLSNNKINCITADELKSLRWGIEIDLSNNRIKKFPDCTLPMRSQVCLRGNPLTEEVKDDISSQNRCNSIKVAVGVTIVGGVGVVVSGFAGGMTGLLISYASGDIIVLSSVLGGSLGVFIDLVSFFYFGEPRFLSVIKIDT